ncbi:MAG: polyprenyl diphosphate synthase [Arcanobacterium sp.]|nr:polyprenyl diphosphate synthase [Arcanobacterium sp.]
MPLHRADVKAPQFAAEKVPQHVAIVMDGNGRWANARGLPRTEGHRAGEFSLMDTIAGAVEAGVQVLSVYAFSTENWKRSPAEVKFLLGYSRDVIHRCREQLREWNVQVRWSGRAPKLWRSVLRELHEAEELTAHCTGMVLNFCMNYGGQAEIVDAVRAIAQRVAAGELSAKAITVHTIEQALYQPTLPPVDLFIRSGGEQRTSNFLLWQAAYAELMFVPEPWPEFTRETLWRCLNDFSGRNRRFGAAIDRVPSNV